MCPHRHSRPRSMPAGSFRDGLTGENARALYANQRHTPKRGQYTPTMAALHVSRRQDRLANSVSQHVCGPPVALCLWSPVKGVCGAPPIRYDVLRELPSSPCPARPHGTHKARGRRLATSKIAAFAPNHKKNNKSRCHLGLRRPDILRRRGVSSGGRPSWEYTKPLPPRGR